MKKWDMDLVILLTATITPNTYSNLRITEPPIRKQQYREALKFYIQQTRCKIVFAENSGDLLEDFPLLPHRIEYLTYKSEPIQPDRGKGYKELEIIDFAFQNSLFLKEAKSVVKVTGRLQVLNIRRISRKFIKLRQKKRFLVYANSYKPQNIDCRCFFFSPDFLPYLKNVQKKLDLHYNLERSLWDAIHQYEKIEGNKFIPFHTPLRVKGQSGTFGNTYRNNLVIHYSRLIRNLAKKLIAKGQSVNR